MVKSILITGGAGRIAYSLIPMVLSGEMFGPSEQIDLRLLDIPEMSDKLHGVKMEIEDCVYPLLSNLIATVDLQIAVTGVEFVILIGGFPRLPGMERKDLLIKNAQSVSSQAKAINRFGSPNTKVLVVANPANTNCLVAIRSAPNIPAKNFSCLTRLDQERLKGFCLQLLPSASSSDPAVAVRDVFILGNHSTTQVAYIEEGVVCLASGSELPVPSLLTTPDAFTTLLGRLQGRGAEIIQKLSLSSAMSAASAICRHMSDWTRPLRNSECLSSMGVLTTVDNHPYQDLVPPGIVFSFPVNCHDGSIYPGMRIQDDRQLRDLVSRTVKELLEERQLVEEFLVTLS